MLSLAKNKHVQNWIQLAIKEMQKKNHNDQQ